MDNQKLQKANFPEYTKCKHIYVTNLLNVTQNSYLLEMGN